MKPAPTPVLGAWPLLSLGSAGAAWVKVPIGLLPPVSVSIPPLRALVERVAGQTADTQPR